MSIRSFKLIILIKLHENVVFDVVCEIDNMKVKEVNRTANIAWSPAPQYPIYLAAGTAAQQLDATFR